MVWPFKIKSQADAIIDVLEHSISFTSEKWLHFTASLPFRDDVELRERIRYFAMPVGEGLRNNFPALREANEAILLIIVAKGIERSGTHSRAELEAALGLPLPE